VLFAVAVAAVTRGASGIFQEFGALAVRFNGEGFDNRPMALLAIPSNYRPLKALLDRLRLRSLID